MASILIVEDRADFRQALAAVLEGSGHRVAQAGDGAQALELARQEAPDLLISHGVCRLLTKPASKEALLEALHSSSAELERRVAERTADLAAENAKLVEEVRQRRKVESRLRAMVDRDSLTGLYNRRYFEQAVAR